MSTVHGLLVHSGVGAKVERIQVGELADIQDRVGGTIDAVRKQVSRDICAVGYVHDEGLILDLEMNWIASALFMREIRGPVVIVNGFNNGTTGAGWGIINDYIIFRRYIFFKLFNKHGLHGGAYF